MTQTHRPIIRRLQPKLARVEGITLYMQPVQDLTVENRVSRTQYQYSLEGPDTNELNNYVPRLITKLQGIGELRDVASDQQSNGLGLMLEIDRDTAARFGITPQKSTIRFTTHSVSVRSRPYSPRPTSTMSCSSRCRNGSRPATH